MDIFEVGQKVDWSLSVTDGEGKPADVGNFPTATVTLPDGTTTAASVNRVGLGEYQAVFTATVVGLHWIRWDGTGTNSDDFPFTDSAVVRPALPRLLRVAELESHIQMTIAAGQRPAAESACDDAATLIRAHLKSDLADLTGWRLDTAKLVAKRSASRFFLNPQQRTSYTGPEGLNYQGGPVRLLTDDEKAMLDGLKGDNVRVGTIRLGVAAWMTPDAEATA